MGVCTSTLCPEFKTGHKGHWLESTLYEYSTIQLKGVYREQSAKRTVGWFGGLRLWLRWVSCRNNRQCRVL
jgi:hypothetical protein